MRRGDIALLPGVPLDEAPEWAITVDEEPEEDWGGILKRVMENAKLSERERFVLRMLFFEEKTQAEVGVSMGVSATRVSQIENRALRKIRHPASNPGIRSPWAGPERTWEGGVLGLGGLEAGGRVGVVGEGLEGVSGRPGGNFEGFLVSGRMERWGQG